MRRAVLAAGLIGLGIAVVVALALIRRSPPEPEAAFDSLLAAADASIARGSLSTAADALRVATGVPRAEADQLRLLKRAFQIGRGSGDFSLLALLADRALAGNGGSARIRAVAAYALLRTGRVADARRLFPRAGTGDREVLRGESLLRAGAPWEGSDGLTRDVLALGPSSDPAAFARAGLSAGDKRLSLDAAVLAMQQGRLAQAAAVVRSDLGDSAFDEPGGLVLYDAGAPGEATVRLQRRFATGPSPGPIGFILADIAEDGGDAAGAQQWLLRGLALAPSVSWTPYADLAVFSLQKGDLASAVSRLEDGLAFFPGSRGLTLLKARVLARSGNTGEATEILESLLAAHRSDTEAALLLLSLQGPALSPEALRGRLWGLFEIAPTDPAVFDRLSSTLVAARDWQGLRLAVEERQAAGGLPDARSLVVQGLAAALSGDDEEALAALRQSDRQARDGTARFDAALVLLRQGAARAARDELESASAEIRATAGGAERARLLSRVETLRGTALMLDGDAEGASTALSRARQLDPNNLRASLLLHKLEAGGQ